MTAQAATAQPEIEAIEYIALKDLKPDPEQPRKYFDPEALQELADDIKARGIMEPILYFIDGTGKKEQWFILAGERRWRAAKLAGLKEVPCLYRNALDPKERLLDQVSENFQRRDLNSIEMAIFFDAMINNHGVKATKLPEELVKYGFKTFDRSYISNIRRLLNLPEWAQQMIQEGKLTAAHGKYLLTAVASDKVMADMKPFLEKHHENLTVRELDEAIENTLDELLIEVPRGRYDNDNNWRQTKFSFREECKACKTCIKYSTQHSNTLYCCNDECYDEKQAAAVKKIEAAEKKKQKAAEKKEQDRIKKVAEKLGCSEEDIKETEKASQISLDDPRAKARAERTQEYLDHWLRTQINAHLLEDDATRYQVVLWMAAGAPGDYGYGSNQWSRAGNASVNIDFEHDGIDLTLNQHIDPKRLELMACQEGIEAMDRDNLRILAHHCGIKLEGSYTIDRDYLDIKIKGEILDITPAAVHAQFDDGYLEKLPAGELKDCLLFNDHLFGVPADLISMYNADIN